MKKLNHSELLQERLSIEEAQKAFRHPVSIILDNIRSLYNVGSIFRTCDSALVSELILCGFTPSPPRKEIEKTALGAVDTVPWKYFQNTQDAVEYQKSKNIKVIAVELTDTKRQYNSLLIDDYPLCLVYGNEISGISDEILQICDDAVEIPMYGVKHSLNVGVAAGITIFSSVEQWKHLASESL